MVEQKELVTLFKIEKSSQDIEQLIPFAVIDGIYNEENCTFMTPDGTVYAHIENAQYPNFGYARRLLAEIDDDAKEYDFNSIEFIVERKFNADNVFKYFRFTSEPNKIYLKGNNSKLPQIFIDEDSQKYKEEQKQARQDIEEDINSQKSYLGINKTPKEICELVKRTIKGQDEAIKTIVTCLWATVNSRNLPKKLSKKQMILIGPTGVGKTAIFEKLQEILDIPVVIFSVPGLSQAGYIGRSTDEILKQVYFETMQNLDVAEKAIVILDEYDKIAYIGDDKSGDISTVGVQNELLKMIEGYTRVIEINDGQDTFEIDTSNMIFIATGAFQELYDKNDSKQINGFVKKESDSKPSLKKIDSSMLIKYGLKKESVGRLPIIIELNSLTREIFKEIILESDESELLAHVCFLESYGVKVKNLEEIIEIIIDDAMAKGIGARGLIATISKLFLEIIYEVANNPDMYSEVIIGKNIINDSKDFELVKKRIIKRTMKLNNSQNKMYR